MYRGQTIVASLIGALCVYCVMDRPGGGDPDAGGMPDAHAEGSTSCETCDVEAPTVIFDGEVTLTEDADGRCLSPEWDVSEFRTVVVQASWRYGNLYYGYLGVKHGSGAGYVYRRFNRYSSDGPTVDVPTSDIVDTRHGTSLRLYLGHTNVDDTCPTRGVTIVGYRSR